MSVHCTGKSVSSTRNSISTGDSPCTLGSLWPSSCVRTVSKPYLFWLLGLAFERKADAPICCKQTKMEVSDRGFRDFSAACKAGALPAELHAHKLNLSRF